jgi:hypothetical protein
MSSMLAGVWERKWEEDPLGCEDDKIDRSTLVVWTQTPSGVYVDLRLPAGAPGRRQLIKDREKQPETLAARTLDCSKYTEEDKSVILQQKSFAGRLCCSPGDTTSGDALKKDTVLAELANANAGPIPLCTCFWEREIDYQPPTGGLDIGVCATSPTNADGSVDMRETGDDASYAEGWRRIPGTGSGPFAALELQSEDGTPRKGFWVRTGHRFAMAFGRPDDEESAKSLACHAQSHKVKDFQGKSLSEAVNLLGNGIDELAIAMSYVGLVGEVKDDGSWRIDASTLPNLVGCDLIANDKDNARCCSTLGLVPSEGHADVGEGTLVHQTIKVNGQVTVVRKWEVVELSSPDALPLL